MLDALKEQQSQVFTANLLAYASLLEEHIHKEDEVLFPWLDQKLTAEQKEELLNRFHQADGNLALNLQKYHDFIDRLERQLR